MFGYGMNNAQQEQFAEQARQRRPIAYVLPHPEFEERHVGGINALDLSCYDDNSNDDKRRRKVLASAGRDASVRLWDVSEAADVKKMALFVGHRGWVNDVKHVPSMNRDSLLVASGGSDKTVRLWSHNLLNSSGVGGSADSNDNKNSNISDASCALGKLRAHDDYVMALATNRDGSILASGGLGGQLFAWDVETLKQKWSIEGASLDEYSLKGAKASIYCLGIAKDANLIVSGGTELALRVWDARMKRKVSKLKGHTDTVRGVCINDDGKIAITASSDGTIRVWDISLGRQSDVFAGAHEGGCWAVSGNANFTRFYSGGAKGDICITDIKERKSAILCRETSDAAGNNGVLDLCVDLSANSSEAWVCTAGKDIRRWRIDSSQAPSSAAAATTKSSSNVDDWFTVGSPAKFLNPSSPASQGFRGNPKVRSSPINVTTGASPSADGGGRSLSSSQKRQMLQNSSPGKRSPTHATPSGIIPSASAVVRHAELHDRMRFLTEDDSGATSVWHISEGLLNTFPNRAFEVVLNDHEINEPCAVPKWFNLSHREGSVEIEFSPSTFAKAESYAIDLGDESANADAKLNLGVEMVQALLIGLHLNTLDETKLVGAKRDVAQKRKEALQKEEAREKQRRRADGSESGTDRDLSSEESSSSASAEDDEDRKASNNRGLMMNKFRAFQFNASSPRLRFSSGDRESIPLEFSKSTPLDISLPEVAKNVPKWALDVALGIFPAPSSAKASFAVSVCESAISDFRDYDVNAIKQKSVNAPRILTIRKVRNYVADKLKMDATAKEDLEILCHGRALKLDMSLATVDAYFWKKGGAIRLNYRFKRSSYS